MNIILAVLELFVLIVMATGSWTYYYDTSTKELEDHMQPYIIGEIVLSVVSMIASGLAIYGAIKYDIKLVLLNIVWLIVGFIIGLVMLFLSCADWEDNGTEYTCEINWGGLLSALVFMLLWVYPHAGFIHEVRAGILTEETYPREQFSCCCV